MPRKSFFPEKIIALLLRQIRIHDHLGLGFRFGDDVTAVRLIGGPPY